ncbi:hypothetical protein P7L74_13845 [Tistrella mobilis]|uniref:hypothetical protein n=1 Tax=Tistrella mobilis TaxID=171437 RepID=UPI0035562339
MANTISDLKVLAVTSSGMEVEVLGYHAVADGGGGLFAWRAGATATDDGGLWIESTVATGGLWQRIVDSAAPVSVRWWGARASGSATTVTVVIDNVIGTNVSTATISTDPAVMTVTFPGTRFYNVSYDLHMM